MSDFSMYNKFNSHSSLPAYTCVFTVNGDSSVDDLMRVVKEDLRRSRCVFAGVKYKAGFYAVTYRAQNSAYSDDFKKIIRSDIVPYGYFLSDIDRLSD